MAHLLDWSFSAIMYLLNTPVLGAIALLLTFSVLAAIINDLTVNRFD